MGNTIRRLPLVDTLRLCKSLTNNLVTSQNSNHFHHWNSARKYQKRPKPRWNLLVSLLILILEWTTTTSSLQAYKHEDKPLHHQPHSHAPDQQDHLAGMEQNWQSTYQAALSTDWRNKEVAVCQLLYFFICIVNVYHLRCQYSVIYWHWYSSISRLWLIELCIYLERFRQILFKNLNSWSLIRTKLKWEGNISF